MRLKLLLKITALLFLTLAPGLFAENYYPVKLQNGKTYRLVKLLKEGQLGIFEALDETGKTVIVKFVEKGVEGQAAALKLADQLKGTSAEGKLVSVLDSGLLPGLRDVTPTLVKFPQFRHAISPHTQGVMVMEPLDGTLADLREWLALGSGSVANPFTADELKSRVDRAFRLTLEMGDLWAGLAEKQLLFSDFKPENVGVTGIPPKVKLLDLGTLKQGPLSWKSSDAERAFLYSSVGYLAPEWGAITERVKAVKEGTVFNSYSDYYSVGKTLLDLFCGQCSPSEFQRLMLTYSKAGLDEESMAKLLFISEFVNASQLKTPAERMEAIRKSSMLSKYFTMVPVPVTQPGDFAHPKVVLTADEVVEAARPRVAIAMTLIQETTLRKRPEWKSEVSTHTPFTGYPLQARSQELGPALAESRGWSCLRHFTAFYRFIFRVR